MKKEYILVIDSGIGGISILKKLVDKYKNESFIYLADNNSSPYGNKTKAYLCGNIIRLINEYMQKYSIKLVIFACNTLTATTIEFARKRIKCPIIGTEPPIKMVKNNKKTLLLATEGTIKYSKLLKEYKNKYNVKICPLVNIATLLDNDYYNRVKIFEELKRQIPKGKYKNVVLGCTHYYYLENELKQIFGENIAFYTSIDGILKRVDNFLIKTKTNYKQAVKIYLTKNNSKLNNTIKLLLSE